MTGNPALFRGATRPTLRRRLVRPDVLLLPVAILLAYALGRSIASGRIALLGLVAGFVLVIALAQATWLPYAASVATVGTFAQQAAFPQLGVPGNPIASDLVLIAAVCSWLVVLSRGGSALGPAAFPLGPQVAVGGILLGTSVGVMVGAANGVPPTDAIRWGRELAFYAAFWLGLTAFADVQARRLLLRLGALTAAAIVAAQILQGLLGTSVVLFYVLDPLAELLTCPESQCADPTSGGFPRVRPPGLVLVYIATNFAAAFLLWGPRRRRRAVAALLGLCSVGLLISLNRNMVVGLVLGLGLAGLLASQRGRLAVVASLSLLIGVLLLGVVRDSPELGSSAGIERLTTLTSLSEVESSSTVADRLRENSLALDAIADSPLVGLGWAVPYGPPSYELQGGELRAEARMWTHNQYLLVWLRTGVVGLLGLIAALVLSIVYGRRCLRSDDRETAWLGAAVISSTAAIGFSSVVGIYIVNSAAAPVLAGVVALAACLEREHRNKVQTL